ncbi:hypothetical protein Gotur_008359 [Gossypium turneri]
MLSALKGRVAKLEGSIWDALSANWDVMKEAPNATKGGQTEKNDALEAMVMALKEKNEAIMEKIKDLEGELAMYSLIDLISRKDMFESSNPKGNGNGREDEERQVKNGNNNSNNEKPQKWEEEA